MDNLKKVPRNNWEGRHKVNQENLFEDLIRILEVFKEPSKEENKNDHASLQKFFLEGEEKKCKVPFLSRVLKCPANVLLALIYNGRYFKIEKFKEDKYKIKELYFQVNKTKVLYRRKKTRLCDLSRDYESIINIINKYPSYILSRNIIADYLDLKYDTFNQIFSVNLVDYQLSGEEELVKIIKHIDNRIKKKQSKSEEDLKDDFLKLLEGASKEALKSEEDLFYYLLLKDFYYFDMLSKYIEEGKDCDFMKICNEIYKKKFPESVENQEFFCENLFSSLLTKFTNFHNNNYLKRLKILEEIEEKYFASKNNESVDNKTIKDNFNNNKFTMKFNADSVVKPNTCDNHYRKRKSIDCNDKSSFKKQRLEGVIKRIHENKSHPLGNSETNFDNQEIVDETKLDNYSKFTLEKFRSKNINDNRLNQDESFNLNLLNQETPASQNLQFSNLENEISNDNKVQYRGF